MGKSAIRRNRRRRQRHEKPYEPPKISAPPPSTTNNTSDIPGFFYDSERRKYFRILPDQHGAGSSDFITPQSIQQRQIEKDRQTLLNKTKFDDGSIKDSVISILAQQQLGLIGSDRIRRRLKENSLKCGNWANDTKDPIVVTIPRIGFDMHYISRQHRHLEISEDGLNIIGWGRIEEGGIGDEVFRYEIDSDRIRKNRSDLRFDTVYFTNLHSTERIIDFVSTSPNSFLLCAISTTSQNSTSTLSHRLISSDIAPVEPFRPLNEHFFDKTVWSCAWNKFSDKVSIGMDARVVIFHDANKNSLATTTLRMPRNALVQKFSSDGNLLFMGQSNAKAVCYDLRSGQTEKVFHQSNVSSLYLTKNDRYAVAANYSGQIKMWDIRMKKAVLSFEGQINSHLKLPLIVDEEDSLVIAGGKYGTTSCWSLRTGEVLRQIASPYPINGLFDLPGIAYTNRLGGIQGNSGIIIGGKGKIYYYPFKY